MAYILSLLDEEEEIENGKNSVTAKWNNLSETVKAVAEYIGHTHRSKSDS